MLYEDSRDAFEHTRTNDLKTDFVSLQHLKAKAFKRALFDDVIKPLAEISTEKRDKRQYMDNGTLALIV